MNCIGVGLLALVACLGHPDPNIRDKVAFERLSTAMRAGEVDRDTLVAIDAALVKLVAAPDPQGFARPFAILTLAEVARTDRIRPWMTDAHREQMVAMATQYLSSITDYRAFDNKEGYRHGVAHGADFAMQLGLNPAVTKPQLDRLLEAIRSQIVPGDPAVAYWAGEPERLARATIVIAQRNLHSSLDWHLWFEKVAGMQPHANWLSAYSSEAGIRQTHNMKAYLFAVLASATSSDTPAVQQLAAPVRDALRTIG